MILVGVGAGAGRRSWVKARGERERAGASPAPTGDRLVDFAQDIFGTPFDDNCIVREVRLDLAEFLAAPPVYFALPSELDLLGERAGEPADRYLARICAAWFPAQASEDLPDPLDLGRLLKEQSFLRTLLDASSGEIVPLAELGSRIARSEPDFAEQSAEGQALILESFLAMIAYARANGGTDDSPRLEPLLTLQVQFWIREMSRLMRAVTPQPAFFWRDDYPEDALPRGLPAYYCRECGHSGWLGHAPRRRPHPHQRHIRGLSQLF